MVYDSSVKPNYPGNPNISSAPNAEAIESVVDAYGRFHAWISKLHVPHFLELSLTLAQLKTLYLVSASGPMRMRAIAEQLGTAASTSSEVVDGLVQLGLLERGTDATDRRQVVVRATAQAHETLEDFHDLGRTRLVELLSLVERHEDLVTIKRAIELLAHAAGTTAKERT